MIYEKDQQFFDDNGDPLASGTVGFYVDGDTGTLQTVYTTTARDTSATNPANLDTAGRLPQAIHGSVGGTYSVVKKDAAAVIVGTTDGVPDIAESAPVAATVAAAKALPLATGQTVTTLGYTTAGDGGHGTYRYDSSSSATADDGAVITPDSGTGRLLLVHQGTISVKQYGAAGDASTDDKTAFQNWAKYLNANSEVAGYVPGVADYYRVTEPFIVLDEVTIYGDGIRSHVHNTVTGSFSWVNSCMMMGTVFGYDTGNAFHDEGATTLNGAVSQGDETIIVTSATGFSVGKIVMLESQTHTPDAAENYARGSPSVTYPKHCQMNEVVGVSGTTITLKYPVSDDYSDGSGVYVEDGSVSLTNGADVQGETVNKMSRRSTVRDLNFSCAENTPGQCQVVHLSTFECRLENITVSGGADAFGINPCAYTTFRNIRMETYGKGFECGYAHNNLTIDGLYYTRIGDEGASSNNDYPCIFSESGQDLMLSNFELHDYPFTGDDDVSALATTCRRHHFRNGLVIAGQGGGVAFIGGTSNATDLATSYGSTMQGVTIVDPVNNGIDIDSNGVSVSDCRVEGTPATKVAVEVEANVTTCSLRDLDLGIMGATTTRDYIKYTGGSGVRPKGMVFENIRSHFSSDGTSEDYIAQTVAVQSAADMQSYTITGDASARQQGWKVRAAGIVTHSNDGTRTIILQVAGTNVETLTYATSAVGSFFIDATIIKQDNTAMQVAYNSILNNTDGPSETAGGGAVSITGLSMTNTNYTIDLNVSVAGTSNTVVINEWSVTPINNQFDWI